MARHHPTYGETRASLNEKTSGEGAGRREALLAGGAALCLIAAFAYAGGVVIQKPLLGRVSALQLTWLACNYKP